MNASQSSSTGSQRLLSVPFAQRILYRLFSLCILVFLAINGLFSSSVSHVNAHSPSLQNELTVHSVPTTAQSQTLQSGSEVFSLGWQPTGGEVIYDAAWGDIDLDGYLDLLIDVGTSLKLYHNNNGIISDNFILIIQKAEAPQWLREKQITFIDIDNDNYLDIVLDINTALNIYHNINGNIQNTPTWSITKDPEYYSMPRTLPTLVDVDNNGYIDIFIHDKQGINYYYNNNGLISNIPIWNFSQQGGFIEWIDINNDTYLDIVLNNDNTKIFINNYGFFATTPTFTVVKNGYLGDINDDNFIDLIYCSDRIKIYTNQQSGFLSTPSWESQSLIDLINLGYDYCNVTITDIDNDGDHDIYLFLTIPDGNSFYYRGILYKNINGNFTYDTNVSDAMFERMNYKWIDFDIDGDLDLIFSGGMSNGPPYGGCSVTSNYIYRNSSGEFTKFWESNENSFGFVSLVDINNDGYLDVTVQNTSICNSGSHSLSNIYLSSEYGHITSNSVWSSGINNDKFISWKDINNDGHLDLTTPNGIYYQKSGFSAKNSTIDAPSLWPAASTGGHDTSLADIDSDGDLDLAILIPGKINIYQNVNGVFTSSPVAAVTSSATYIVWGDVDNDGDLDLVSSGQSINIYQNNNGILTSAPIWSIPEQSSNVAWGDVDNDGDLDLASSGQSLRLYENNNGTLATIPIWTIAEQTVNVAWGDVDNDGDLDLVSNGQSVALYQNNNGTLVTIPIWTIAEQAINAAWGDVDNDGDLDLAISGEFLHLYENINGILQVKPVWSPLNHERTWYSSNDPGVWHDVDNDGDLDFTNNFNLYINTDGTLANVGIRTSPIREYQPDGFPIWGDVDRDGDTDLIYLLMPYMPETEGFAYIIVSRSSRSTFTPQTQIPTIVIQQPTAATPYYATAHIWAEPTLTFTYTLRHPSSKTVQRVVGQYSLNGGPWHTAVPTSNTQTTNLASSPTGTQHTFSWDILGNSVMGQSDNTVFRLVSVSIPHILVPQNTVSPSVYGHGSYASSTFPFRLRGNQIRVFDDATPASSSLVYRLPVGLNGQFHPYADLRGREYRTDRSGYLQGRGQINVGDRLVAMTPISHTTQFSLYHTSGIPTTTGIAATPVTTLGVQNLTTSAANPLMLFHLAVSLEWDARQDPQYLQKLHADLARVSEVLYDWSNGQVALGDITIYHQREHWNDAHVRIYATNRLRPNATQGGIITEPITDPFKLDIAYTPGQIHMGATWNRYGDLSIGMPDDWARTLAHELGHYALFLNDNYLGLDPQGRLIAVDSCPGAMSDPYRQDYYSEFHPDTDWLPSCAQTLSQQEGGRSDWSTITTFYPWIKAPATSIQTTNTGPNQLPLDVTHITMVSSMTPTTTINTPIFFTVHGDGSRYVPGNSARAVLFQNDRLVDLGQPSLDQVLARGAAVGDRLCVYDGSRTGCELIQTQDEYLTITPHAQWTPQIVLSPVTSRTLSIHVANLPSELSLQARVFSTDGATSQVFTLPPVAGGYERLITLAEPTAEGHVQVWVDEPAPRREIVTHYAVGGNPGYRRVRVGYRRVRVAPILSPDGQALLFGGEIDLQENELYILQAATTLPEILPWATAVGNGYWLSASPNAPSLTNTSMSISYLDTDVPSGEEHWIRMYFWNGTQWKKLATSVDTYHNTAVANTQGSGLYVLMSSIEVPLRQAGWNLVAYPVAGTQPITEALQSIAGFYTIVYGFDSTDPNDPWKLYAPDVPDWVSDLPELEFGQGYWIYATEPVTLSLKGGSQELPRLGAQTPTQSVFPPATYYGEIESTVTFTPTAGMTIEAVIGGTVCGQTTTEERNGAIIYRLKVAAADPQSVSCGMQGRGIIMMVDGATLSTPVIWDNRRAWHHRFNANSVIYLPLLRR